MSLTTITTASTTTNHHPLTIAPLPPLNPDPPAPGQPPSHHIGSPPTSFQNPWPSAKHDASLLAIFRTRFSSNRNFVPVPEGREGLVKVRECDWGRGADGRVKEGLKATWIGHATWVVETSAGRREDGASSEKEEEGVERDATTPSPKTEEHRGIRLLLDPVFADRTSPFSFFGPKRYTPTPCTISQLPFIDVLVQSHNHYDHVDAEAVKALYTKQKGRLQIFCALGNKAWYLSLLGGYGLREDGVTELDWWEGVRVGVEGVGAVRLYCTPAQHTSARTPFDRDRSLWCSWVLKEDNHEEAEKSTHDDTSTDARIAHSPRTLFFAGDTGYRAVSHPTPTPTHLATLPTCPAFSQIGLLHGPFDLALLPIGLYSPRHIMSAVHCAPEDSVCIHKDLRSKKSVGMHWGTVRGGISSQYEDVTEPPRRWREECERAGLEWGGEVGLCEVGETVVV